MRHESLFDINPNHVEQFLILFQASTTIVAYYKYPLPYNALVSRGRIKHIRLHTFDDGNFPAQYNFNGYNFNTLSGVFASYVMLTIADRKGGYFCQDLPLSEFLQKFTGHGSIKCDLSIDNDKSFIWFNLPFNIDLINTGIAMIFYMDMYPKLND